jgi:hypothetical protein
MKKLIILFCLITPLSIEAQSGYERIKDNERTFINVKGERHYVDNNLKVYKTENLSTSIDSIPIGNASYQGRVFGYTNIPQDEHSIDTIKVIILYVSDTITGETKTLYAYQKRHKTKSYYWGGGEGGLAIAIRKSRTVIEKVEYLYKAWSQYHPYEQQERILQFWKLNKD